MSDWKWEAEIGVQYAGPAYVTNIGGLGVFGTETEAESAARKIIGGTVGDYRKNEMADPYAEAIAVPDTAIVTGATLQRFNDDGIDWDSQRDLP
ncbi:Uncharacterised protein (plasmid) [Tsukamurella tyrosinosolvens]|uniref:Uncharacterized protein n=1 Tax=Tsukamurella tyrosinosolvens TaxID=57704 RepID=A0A1H4V408_TSUTY|nr:hypothetical protein [Tsukamurella tyrosinosolvens]KXO91055.1 hypothetical protein AXK58_21735 [Tsukamurella tyrosinosolvens]SEC75717.1 hypothetical protein SAMN04489793_3134 [Tsukamurella tyrosinosolvens]VEH90696.1 Uncharacterised protein [Tsukamurella tyrosinosolvens]